LGKWPAELTGGHRDANDGTACPGPFMYRRIDEINLLARDGGRATARPKEEQGMTSGYCEYGDEGWRIGVLQRKLQDIDGDALPEYGVDEQYGDETASELARILSERAGWGSWDGKRLTTNAAATLDGVHARAWADE